MDTRLLIKVSKLYYDVGLTQNDIAEKLNLSRPKVSRMLTKAREEGIVQIAVHSPPGIHAELETELENAYGLEEVMIVDTAGDRTQEAVSRNVGMAAASFFARTVHDGSVVGVSWGTTLKAMVGAIQSTALPKAHIVQIIGGLGSPEADEHATELCRRVAHTLACRLTLLPAPGIVENRKARDLLVADRHVCGAFDLFPRLDTIFAGLGAPTPDSVLMKNGMIMTADDLEDIRSRGAVGDIALRFFDSDGRHVRSDLDDRVIGIPFDQLQKVPRVVALAGGPDKASVIHAALSGHFIHVLITDEQTGRWLLGKTPVSIKKKPC